MALLALRGRLDLAQYGMFSTENYKYIADLDIYIANHICILGGLFLFIRFGSCQIQSRAHYFDTVRTSKSVSLNVCLNLI